MKNIKYLTGLLILIVAVISFVNYAEHSKQQELCALSAKIRKEATPDTSGTLGRDDENVTTDKEKMYPGIVLAHSLWIENERYLYDYKDGFQSGDKEFLLQMAREGKAKFAEKPAGVVCSGDYGIGKIIRIRFFEGRYKNKSGYIFADFVRKIEK